ncbi:hypothetical protein NDU88_007465 [Pleurodeles waltl]|uniref:Uncharacterized protein n=1 Tax=Pleurodeles waltl TaxID=8319 RepID=A0AAV7QPX6_PLEWA|nr:hypothetical protein NDU88_007465 [Pleurodeles waltl]
MRIWFNAILAWSNQKISDLEDNFNQLDSTTVQSREDINGTKAKLDEMEARACQSNLRFVGVPEGQDKDQDVAQLLKMHKAKVVSLHHALDAAAVILSSTQEARDQLNKA